MAKPLFSTQLWVVWQIYQLNPGKSTEKRKKKSQRCTALLRAPQSTNIKPLSEISFMPSHRGISVSERKTLSARKMKDKIGFVKQQDTLLEHLTGKSTQPPNAAYTFSLAPASPVVRETLWYAAALRLPNEISAQTRELIVTQTIEGSFHCTLYNSLVVISNNKLFHSRTRFERRGGYHCRWCFEERYLWRRAKETEHRLRCSYYSYSTFSPTHVNHKPLPISSSQCPPSS